MAVFQLSEYQPTHSLSDFEFLHDPKDRRSKLGLGSFATVKLAREKNSGKLFALKLIDIDPSKTTKSDLENLKREILIHKDLNHPHVIKFNGYIHEGKFVYLILDYAENGNLYSYHHRKKSLTEKEIFRFFHQTCLAINYIHQNDVIHRDIKPENLLLDKDFNIKICDFGWSAFDICQERQTFCGTYEYMAPEIVNKKTYDHRVDIWAIGVLLYELMHNRAPFRGRTMHEIKTSLASGEMTFSNDIPSEAKNLIQNILKDDPKHRVIISDILADSWVQYHLEKEEVFRKSVYQDDLKNEGSKQQKLKIFDKEEVKKPNSILINSVEQFFSAPTQLKKAVSSTTGSTTTNQSRPDDISPFNLSKTIANGNVLQVFDSEKHSPKSAVFSASRISEDVKTPPKLGNTKRIFDNTVLSPAFTDRLNRVLNTLNTTSKPSLMSTTKYNKEVVATPASCRGYEGKSNLNFSSSSREAQEKSKENMLKPVSSRSVLSFVIGEETSKITALSPKESLDTRSLRNVSNFNKQDDQIKSPNNENQKALGTKIFNEEPQNKLMSRLIEDFNFVKNLLAGPNKTGNQDKENTAARKLGQRNL